MNLQIRIFLTQLFSVGKPHRMNISYRLNNIAYVLGDELELVQVVYNCYSKRRLANFYSLMNYILLKLNNNKINRNMLKLARSRI